MENHDGEEILACPPIAIVDVESDHLESLVHVQELGFLDGNPRPGLVEMEQGSKFLFLARPPSRTDAARRRPPRRSVASEKAVVTWCRVRPITQTPRVEGHRGAVSRPPSRTDAARMRRRRRTVGSASVSRARDDNSSGPPACFGSGPPVPSCVAADARDGVTAAAFGAVTTTKQCSLASPLLHALQLLTGQAPVSSELAAMAGLGMSRERDWEEERARGKRDILSLFSLLLIKK